MPARSTVAPTKTNKDLAAELCRKHPKETTRGIARMLFEKHKKRFGNYSAARNAVNYARGTKGDYERRFAAKDVKVKPKLTTPRNYKSNTTGKPRPGNRELLVDIAAAAIRETPSGHTRTIAKRILKERPDRFKSFEQATSAVARARGVGGCSQTVVRCKQEPKSHAWKASCPPSAAEPYAPVGLGTRITVLSLSDMHVPYHDQKAIEAAVKYGVDRKPDIVLLNGDTMDFYRMSRWQQDPNKRDLKYEVETGKEMLVWLRSKFPKARFIFKMGNHENRLNNYIWNRAAEFWNLDNLQIQNVLGFEDLGIERVDDQIILAGKLPILHGHELPKGANSPVNPARGAFLRTLHSVLIGHFHRSSTQPEKDMLGGEMAVWSQGCLCDMRPEYMRFNKWNHGFAVVYVSQDGSYGLQNLRIGEDYSVRPA
jgi:predicted phosphodiesterase